MVVIKPVAALICSVRLLLAAVALQLIHRVDGNRVATYVVVVVHCLLLRSNDSPQSLLAIRRPDRIVRMQRLRGLPLYNRNHTIVIPQHVVFRVFF